MPTQSVSSAFVNAMCTGSSSGFAYSASVYSGGEPVEGYQDLPVEGVSVSADRNSAQRTTASVTITPDPDTYWPAPTDMGDVLAPNGNELVVSAGFIYSDGSTETCPLGIFPIVTVTVAATAGATGNVTITVAADDRSWAISRRGLLQPYEVPTDDYGNPTTTVDQAILTLLEANTSGLVTATGAPLIQYSITPTANLAPATTYDQGQDPWAASLDLAEGEGYEMFVNVAGNVECYPLPDPALRTSPDWTFSDPPVSSAIPIKAVTRTLTGDNVSNDYYVTTDSDSEPQMWEQYDGNPASATNVTSKFGRICTFVASEVSSDLTSAQLEATYDLVMSLGQVDTLSLQAVANAAVQIDDVCLVTCQRIGVVGVMYVVDGFTSNFNSSDGSTTYTLRRVVANSSSGQVQPVPSDGGTGYYDLEGPTRGTSQKGAHAPDRRESL